MHTITAKGVSGAGMRPCYVLVSARPLGSLAPVHEGACADGAVRELLRAARWRRTHPARLRDGSGVGGGCVSRRAARPGGPRSGSRGGRAELPAARISAQPGRQARCPGPDRRPGPRAKPSSPSSAAGGGVWLEYARSAGERRRLALGSSAGPLSFSSTTTSFPPAPRSLERCERSRGARRAWCAYRGRSPMTSTPAACSRIAPGLFTRGSTSGASPPALRRMAPRSSCSGRSSDGSAPTWRWRSPPRPRATFPGSGCAWPASRSIGPARSCSKLCGAEPSCPIFAHGCCSKVLLPIRRSH